MKITSKDNKKIKQLIKLKNSGAPSSFLINGFDMVNLAYSKGLLLESYSLKENSFDNNILVTEEIMDKLSFHKGNDVVGVARLEINNIFGDKIVYLDEISDPYNLGLIILLATQYGYKDIILSNKCTSIFNFKCLDECKNNIFDINFHFNGNEIIRELKNEYQIISTGLKSSVLLKDVLPVSKKHIIVFGNEAHGVSDYIFSLSNDIIRIDIKNIDSLNVAICAGIVLNELGKESN